MADNSGHDTTYENSEVNENSPSLRLNDLNVNVQNETVQTETVQNKTVENENGSERVKEKAVYEDEAKRLRKLLRLYFYSAFKWKGNTCYFHFIYCFAFLIEVIKVALLTRQLFQFGNDRGNFSSVVNRGELVLRHLLLENWDAGRETLPYPPAQGDFAVYNIDDLESGINYAVKNNHLSSSYLIITPGKGHYRTTFFVLQRGKKSNWILHTYSRRQNDEKMIPIDKGLTTKVTKENETEYNYDIAREFEHHNLSQPMKRMLSTTLHFQLHSVRSHESSRKATCLRVEGSVQFLDLDNNGQMLVDLETKSSRIKCKDMNLSIPDWHLENTSEVIGAAVIALSGISLILTFTTMIFALYTFRRTKRFMKSHYRSYYGVEDENGKESDLPASEYFRFLKFWDIAVIISDILTLDGTVWIVFNTVLNEWVLELLDSYIVWLGIGCVLAWLSLLRFFKFHNKFHLLFSTLYRAFWDVIAYLVCVGVLFVGFWVCGYVVMAPYHVKFKTPVAAAETLFAVVNGDEINATLALLESDKSGGNWVWWFSRFYIGAYIAIFTIVVINLLIALFNSAYESIKSYYEDKPEEQELSPLEKALRRVLDKEREESNLRSSIYNFMNEGRLLTKDENTLRMELSKIVRVSKTQKDVVLLKPRTLKAFMEDEHHRCKKFKCGVVKCSFTLFADDEPTSKDEICESEQRI